MSNFSKSIVTATAPLEKKRGNSQNLLRKLSHFTSEPSIKDENRKYRFNLQVFLLYIKDNYGVL